MIRQSYAATRIFLHILAGIVLLVLTGSLWNNKTQVVKATKQWWLRRIIHLLGIEIQTHGTPPRPTNGRGILFVSNHVSWVDIPLIGGLSQLNFLSKAEVRNWPLIGKLAEGTGTLFIQRGSGDAERMTNSIAEYLNEGRSVLFFPEGTTSNGRNVRKFHGKLFKTALHTDVSLCPIAIHYHVANTDHNPVAFIGDDEFTTHLWSMLKHRNIIATVEFLPVRKAKTENLEEFVRSVQREVSHSVSTLNASYGVNTNIRWPDASTPADPRDEAASF